ncbi:hypothetical protein [Frankia tisae]|nr:hypothetical protein [Frankia tisae]
MTTPAGVHSREQTSTTRGQPGSSNGQIVKPDAGELREMAHAA